MNSWFRMYNEVVHDPKVQRLTGDQFKAWVNLMCLANANGGKLPPIEDISFTLRVTESETKSTVSSLVSMGLFDVKRSGVVEPHNWKQRQFKSDSSTERVKRFRDRYRNAPDDVTVTPPETEQNRTETPTPSGPTFGEFWKVYPKHVGKTIAQRAWERISPDPPLHRTMIEAIALQKQTDQWRKNRGQFIPHAATWINQRRWEDEVVLQVEERRPQGVVL